MITITIVLIFITRPEVAVFRSLLRLWWQWMGCRNIYIYATSCFC